MCNNNFFSSINSRLKIIENSDMIKITENDTLFKLNTKYDVSVGTMFQYVDLSLFNFSNENIDAGEYAYKYTLKFYDINNEIILVNGSEIVDPYYVQNHTTQTYLRSNTIHNFVFVVFNTFENKPDNAVYWEMNFSIYNLINAEQTYYAGQCNQALIFEQSIKKFVPFEIYD